MAYFSKRAPQRMLQAALCIGALAGCASGRVQVIGGLPNDPGYPGPRPKPAPHAHKQGSIYLPSDHQIVEPSRPAADTPQERALVHIHAKDKVCSGVVVGPRLVLTSRQCVTGDAQRAVALSASDNPYRVEVASGTLTWTPRVVTHVVAPACEWERFDVAVLVLKDPVPVDAITPMRFASSPGPGGGVQALGFGNCLGENRNLPNRVGTVLSSEPDAIVISIPLCMGDLGGPVVERASGGVVGVISHQDDPDGSPRRTTTIMRFDTSAARSLLAQANLIAEGADVTKQSPIACD